MVPDINSHREDQDGGVRYLVCNNGELEPGKCLISTCPVSCDSNHTRRTLFMIKEGIY